MAQILIVDDEKSIRVTLSEFLQEAGHEVEVAENADEATQLLNEKCYDIMLTDIVLPGMSGVGLLRHIRSAAPDAIVIMITGEPTMDTAVESVRAGAYDYLTKPITREVILPVIARAARLKQLQDEKRSLELSFRQYQEGLERMIQERTRSLREKESLYMSLVESLPLHILRKDLDGRFIFANQKFCRSLGKTSEDIYGKTDFDFFPPDLAEKYQKDDRKIIESKQPFEIIEEHQIAGGPRTFVQVIKTPFCDFQGKIKGLQCIFWDITGRKTAEDQLRKLASAVEQSPVSIMITNLAGNIEFVNPKFTEMTGYELNEVVGKNPRFLKSSETPPEIYQQLWQTILEGKEWRGELHNKRKDGTLCWVSACISSIHDTDRQITHFIAVEEDTTEKKTLEAMFLRSQRLESIGSLASGIAHDLNNIMTSILLSLPLLRERVKEEKCQRLINAMDSSAQRAVGVVRQLLSLGHDKLGEKTSLDIRHLIREMDKMIRETFPKSIQLNTELAPNLWPINGNATQIHQILLNLCVNARDAMLSGGALTLRVDNIYVDQHFASMQPEAKIGHYIRIQVQDTGTGIPASIRDRIFDPFYTTKGPDKGTGLGLTTVLGIVKNHNGFITLTSLLNHGTTFEVYIPATPSADVVSTTETASLLPCGKGELILFVDDEPIIRHVTEQTLQRFGYKVLLAEDGVDAIAKYTANPDEIRLIMTDLYMPLMDGILLCRTLKKLNPQISIIVATGAITSETAPEIFLAMQELGIEQVISKPYTSKTILNALHALLHGSSESGT